MYVEVKQILIVGYWFKRASSFRNCKCSTDEHYSVFHIISGIVSRENVWEGRSQSYFDSGNSELYKHPVWTKIYLSESKSKKLRLVLTVAVHLDPTIWHWAGSDHTNLWFIDTKNFAVKWQWQWCFLLLHIRLMWFWTELRGAGAMAPKPPWLTQNFAQWRQDRSWLT